jgi:hypothetical protein
MTTFDPNKELSKEQVKKLVHAYVTRIKEVAVNSPGSYDLSKECIGLLIDPQAISAFIERTDVKCTKFLLLYGLEDKTEGGRTTVVLMGLDENGKLILDDSKEDVLAFERWGIDIDRIKKVGDLSSDPESLDILLNGVLE